MIVLYANKMIMLIRFSLVFLLFWNVRPYACSSQPLLLVVLDGFRYDFVDSDSLPGGLAQFKAAGTYARKLEPVFPSLTYPNLNALITGLYPESNGFVANVMYDPDHQTTFYSPSEDHGADEYWWNVSIPIWATAVANQVKTGMYAWPSCNIMVNGSLPDYCIAHVQYQELTIFSQHLDVILERFAHQELQFAIVYLEYVDQVGHAEGPDSAKMKQALLYVDQIFVNLMDNLKKKIDLDVNIIITSDHGLIESEANVSTHLTLNEHLNLDDINMVTGDGTIVGVYPKIAKFENVYHTLKSNLKGVEVYKRQDLPEEYHLKFSNRTAPILLIAEPNYVILPLLNTGKEIPPITEHAQYHTIGKGVHGYDPKIVPEMNGILIFYGPAFNKGYSADVVKITDLYNMMTCLLEIRGQPNNGSWNTICPFLMNSSSVCNCPSNIKNTAAIYYSLPPALFLPFVFLVYTFLRF